MAISRSNFTRQSDHIAVAVRGAHPSYRLEFVAPVNENASQASITQGSIVSLNSSGEFVLGCGAGTAGGVNYPVPMISMKNAYDPDVTTGILGNIVSGAWKNTAGTSTNYSSYDLRTTYSGVGGSIVAVPLTGSYEIETTEYYGTGFQPNDGLVVGTSGKITKATQVAGTSVASSGEVYVGFVSKVPDAAADNYGGHRIGFFANFIPAGH